MLPDKVQPVSSICCRDQNSQGEALCSGPPCLAPCFPLAPAALLGGNDLLGCSCTLLGSVCSMCCVPSCMEAPRQFQKLVLTRSRSPEHSTWSCCDRRRSACSPISVTPSYLHQPGCMVSSFHCVLLFIVKFVAMFCFLHHVSINSLCSLNSPARQMCCLLLPSALLVPCSCAAKDSVCPLPPTSSLSCLLHGQGL